LLEGRLSLVDKPAAKYALQIRLEEYTDYATRNSRGVASTGFIMFSVCTLPHNDMRKDCQNLTFYYFGRESRVAMFRRAVGTWLDLILE
jgi:hypothetical protein